MEENQLVKVKKSCIRVGIVFLSKVKRSLCDERYRAIILMKIFNSKRLQQTTSLTYMDRYPTIFAGCRDYFKGQDNIKILSYGCSTGEEVLTLRRYFPNATIVGAEINPHSLRICKSLPLNEKTKFINSTPREIIKQGPYDIVFCMAVLQRTPHVVTEQKIKSLKKIYPFEKFEKQVIELDQSVAPQGLMVIHFSQYSFEDTKISSRYQALGEYNQDDYHAAIFDKNSNIIIKPIPRKSIFVKRVRSI